MRKWILPAATVAIVLVLASAAIAKLIQTSRITLSTHQAAQSTGFTLDVHSRDPRALGVKPKRATKLVVTFPAGTAFNMGLVNNCALTDKQLTTAFGPTCPSSTQIGTGTGIVNAMPMAPKPAVDGTVTVFVTGANTIIIVLVNNPNLLPGTPPIIIHGTVSGARLTLQLPRVVYGKNSKFKFGGVTAVIARLTLSVPAIGSGRNALITSGRCTAHKFVVKSSFTYDDRSTKELKSASSCS